MSLNPRPVARAIVVAGIFLYASAPARAQMEMSPEPTPATQPTTAPAGPVPPRLAVAIDRLQNYLAQLGLSDAQKAEIEKLFLQVRQSAQELREQAQREAFDVAPRVQEMVQGLRQDLAGILTQQQLQRLRDMIAEGGGLGPGRGARGPGARPGGPAGPLGPMMLPDMGGAQRRGPPSDAADATPPQPDAPLLEIGKAAPDFTLKRPEGQPIQLLSFKGKLVLLVFGSYSSPSFRQRAAALDQMKRDLGMSVNIFVIYTRENHPVGQFVVERNKDEGVSVEQPTDSEGRLSVARHARGVLKLSVPILLDSMDDATARAYAGLTTSAAYLIDRDGNVAAAQRWFEPYSMRRQIDAALRGSSSVNRD